MYTIGAVIKSHRLAKNLTQEELGKKLLTPKKDGFILKEVSHRPEVYVSASYEYRGEKIVYEVLMFEDAEKVLRINYIEKECYEAIEHEGQTYYYSAPVIAEGEVGQQSLSFLKNGELVSVYLPGSYSFEEALELIP